MYLLDLQNACIVPWISSIVPGSAPPSVWRNLEKLMSPLDPMSTTTSKNDTFTWKWNRLNITIYLTGVVGQDPWKDWILHEVIVWAASQSIEVHQILKVSDFSILLIWTRANLCKSLPLSANKARVSLAEHTHTMLSHRSLFWPVTCTKRGSDKCMRMHCITILCTCVHRNIQLDTYMPLNDSLQWHLSIVTLIHWDTYPMGYFRESGIPSTTMLTPGQIPNSACSAYKDLQKAKPPRCLALRTRYYGNTLETMTSKSTYCPFLG